MMQWLYFASLLATIGCLVLVDWRYKAALFSDVWRTTITIGVTMSLFIIWDLLGIHLDIFFSGNSAFALPFMIVPNFPVEELLFVFVLSYVTLLIYLGAKARWQPTS